MRSLRTLRSRQFIQRGGRNGRHYSPLSSADASLLYESRSLTMRTTRLFFNTSKKRNRVTGCGLGDLVPDRMRRLGSRGIVKRIGWTCFGIQALVRTALYPQEILHQLPPEQTLLYYNEITHWKYAQHAYAQMYPRADRNGDLPPPWSHDIYERRPDQCLTMVYNRLSFYAWPRYYHRVFNDLMRYGAGDITHSSGHHDHFNQWMWQRLLWAPRTSVEDVVDEYCQTWFGREAAPLMAEAIFQLEENLEETPTTPLIDKDGIDRNYDSCKPGQRRRFRIFISGATGCGDSTWRRPRSIHTHNSQSVNRRLCRPIARKASPSALEEAVNVTAAIERLARESRRIGRIG